MINKPQIENKDYSMYFSVLLALIGFAIVSIHLFIFMLNPVFAEEPIEDYRVQQIIDATILRQADEYCEALKKFEIPLR